MNKLQNHKLNKLLLFFKKKSMLGIEHPLCFKGKTDKLYLSEFGKMDTKKIGSYIIVYVLFSAE